MVSFSTISYGIGPITIDFDTVQERFLSKGDIIDLLIKDLNTNKNTINKYKNNLLIRIKDNGMYSDFNDLIKHKLSQFNIVLKNNQSTKDKIKELKEIITNINHLKNINNQINKPYMKEIYLSFKKYKKSLKTNNQIKKNNNYFKMFKELLIKNIEECIELYSLNNIYLSNITSICNTDKLYYYIAIHLSHKRNNNNYKQITDYLNRYISNISNYITESNCLDKDKLGIDSEYSFSISSILNLPGINKPKKPTQSIKNLRIYDYIFLNTNNIKLIREQLGKYIELSNKTNNSQLGTILSRKSKYFLSLNPSEIRQGINRYKGYIGFVIGSKVILEHFLTESQDIVSNEAIYIINEEDFDSITRMGKLDIIQKIKNNEIQVDRIYHTGSWEERLTKKLTLKKN